MKELIATSALFFSLALCSVSAQVWSNQEGVYTPRQWKQIVHNSEESFYNTSEAREIADNVLLYQRNTGGWPKNIPIHKPLTERQRAIILQDKLNDSDSTTDNDATIFEMIYLSKMYKHTKDKRYRVAFEKGVNYLLDAQYANGGWPQFWPNPKGYQKHITYNDDSMVQIMHLLRDIRDKAPLYADIATSSMVKKASTAFDKGVQCILDTQIRHNGQLTVWCQQHDCVTLLPAMARSYELPSFVSKESALLVMLLMDIEHPSPEIITSVKGAMSWFEAHKISDTCVKRFINEDDVWDRKVMEEKDADPIWARFYDLETGKAFFCDRDGIKREYLYEIGVERRGGYAWFSESPRFLYPTFEAWRIKYAI